MRAIVIAREKEIEMLKNEIKKENNKFKSAL